MFEYKSSTFNFILKRHTSAEKLHFQRRNVESCLILHIYTKNTILLKQVVRKKKYAMLEHQRETGDDHEEKYYTSKERQRERGRRKKRGR